MRRTILTAMVAALFALGSATAQFAASGKGGYGPANGSGYQGNGPKDGTGYGAKAGKKNGTGTCDGTGPKGARRGAQGKGGRR